MFRAKIDWFTRRHLFARTCTCIRLIIYCPASIEYTIKRTRSGVYVLYTRAVIIGTYVIERKKKPLRTIKPGIVFCTDSKEEKTRGRTRKATACRYESNANIYACDDAQFTLFKRRPYYTYIYMHAFRKHAHGCSVVRVCVRY